MVEVTIYQSVNGRVRGFRVTGHAREASSAASAGNVCGGVSALMLHTVAALRDRAGLEIEYRIGPGGTWFRLPAAVPEEKRAAAALLLGALRDSFTRMSERYGEYMNITFLNTTGNEELAFGSQNQEEVSSHGTQEG